jgi:phage portal protein BeeE
VGWWSRLTRRRTESVALVRTGMSWPTPDDSGFTKLSQWNAGGDIQRLYETCAYVYAAISANAIEASSLGAQVQTLQDGRWIADNEHPLNELIRAPSGVRSTSEQWTWRKLIFLAAAHLQLVGNAYIYPRIVDRRRVYALDPILPSSVTIQEDPTTLYPDTYRIGAETYRPEQIVHMVYTSPYSLSSGAAPILAALRAMAIDWTADERVAYNLENKVAPGLIFTLSGFTGLTDAQRTAVVSFLSENYAGSTKDGRPLVFGEGTTVTAPPTTTGTDYAAIRKAARDEILAVFHTPPPVIGVYDNATLNNFKQAFEIWWLLSLFPLLASIYDDLNIQLIQRVYGPSTRLWYDDTGSEIGLLLLDKRVETAAKLVSMGYPPALAAERLRLDMPFVEGLDTPLMNLAVAGRNPT